MNKVLVTCDLADPSFFITKVECHDMTGYELLQAVNKSSIEDRYKQGIREMFR